jgi:hypothetical protein
MVQQFTLHPNDYLIWEHYDALDIPVLCLRGAESDLVLPETTARMLRARPACAACPRGRGAGLRPCAGAQRPSNWPW